MSGPQRVCPCLQSVCFPGLYCSGSRSLCRGTVENGSWVVCTSQVQVIQVQILGYSTKAPTGLGLSFVPLPGPNSSDYQVLGEHSLPGGQCILITSTVPDAQFPGCAMRVPSHVCQCLLWGGDKMHCPPGESGSPSIWLPELLKPGKDTKCMPS